ncbi:MAG: DMT family transporter [Candidatus Brocadiia bacterium]|nr:DMT family transporter [Candidatus Brocadiia bacterium]
MPHVARPSSHARTRIVDPGLLMVALMWGVGNVVFKWILLVFDPAAFLALRMSIMSVVMIAWLLLSGPRRRLPTRDALIVTVLGGGLIAAWVLSYASAMKMTTASEGTLLISTAPVWTALIAAILGMELVTGLNWLGIAVALGGVAMVVFLAPGEAVPRAPERLLGDLLMIAAAWMYGGYMVISKRWMQRFGELPVICRTYAGSGVLLAAVGAPRLLDADWAAITPGHWVGAAYVTLLAGAVATVMWYRAIARTSASGTAVYHYLVPGVAVICAAIFLGETLAALQVVGFAVTLVGVYLARVPPPPAAAGAKERPTRQLAAKLCEFLQSRRRSDK